MKAPDGMARAAIVVGSVAFLAASPAWAWGPFGTDDRGLLDEVERYRPPAYYGGAIAAPAKAAEGTAAPDDFDASIRKLRELEARWDKSLAEPAPDESFLVPDAPRVARLSGAAGDDGAAERALSDGFPLADLEALALLRNPAVAAKERELRAALDGYSQAENLDTILRRYSAFTSGVMTGIGPMDSPDAMARARFPFPGVLALKGEIVTQEAAAARETLEAARRDAVTSVRKGYRELLYVLEARSTTESTLDLLDHLKSAASARYSAGETSFQDVLKIGIERERMREELRTLGEMRGNVEAMIRETLALPPSARIGTPAADPVAAAVPELGAQQAKAGGRRQELRAMRAMVGKMERMLLMQETMVHPGFSLNLSVYGRDEASRVGAGGMGGEKEDFPTSTVASVGAGLPKAPLFGMQEAYLRELRQRILALKADLRMEEAATALRVRNAWFALDKAAREEALYGDRVVTLSRSALEASNEGYSAGKVPFADVIESYRGWLEANLALARARADRGTAFADLEAAVGTRVEATGTGPEPVKGERQ
jgi:outer membrane protein TolC